MVVTLKNSKISIFIITLLCITVSLVFANEPQSLQQPRSYSIPLIDLSNEKQRQTVVDREPEQSLGHPTSVLLEDMKTIVAVYTKGLGRGVIVMKRSTDGGLTWSERLPVPKSWDTSLGTPTIYRVIDKQGKKRLIVFSGLYPIRSSISEDDGKTWTELQPIGGDNPFGGMVAMSSMEQLNNGDYMALFHDNGKYLHANGTVMQPPIFIVYKTISTDGGLTWTQPEVIASKPPAQLCEPGLIRSPDGKQLAVLLREESHQYNSYVTFSNDEGKTWSDPRELPGALTGHRHVGKYAPDGRLLISFRDMTLKSTTHGDWVAWVGVYDDIVKSREGQYRVRLMKNYKNDKGVSGDCCYPGVEVFPNGTFVTTTYGHWSEGEPAYIMSVRLALKELDSKIAR